MAILKIAKMGHPVLRRAAAKVDDPSAPEIARLASDMRETLEDIGARHMEGEFLSTGFSLYQERVVRGERHAILNADDITPSILSDDI